MNPEQVYSVRGLVSELRHLLETSYRTVWIEGEISNLARPASGHLYFSLKEGNAIIRCAFFRNRRAGSASPDEGMQVLVKGQISVYENRGDLQLIIRHLEPAGEGALRRAFDALKKKLSAEGLFDQDTKLSLPQYPRTIGIITSPTGAALHDIRTTLNRRYPAARIVLYPALVQGEQAASEICTMLELAASRQEVDVLILARGGGSLEDLQAFNEEIVARAIYKCRIPLLAGIGHETDFTIADMVADQRAPTPTAAAEMVSPSIGDIYRNLDHSLQSLKRCAERHLNQLRQKVDYASACLIHPTQRLEKYIHKQQALESSLIAAARQFLMLGRYELERNENRLFHHGPGQQFSRLSQKISQQQHSIRQQTLFTLASNQGKLAHLKASVRMMSPKHTLNRGYAILQNQRGKVVNSTTQIHSGQNLVATISDGKFAVKVEAPPNKENPTG